MCEHHSGFFISSEFYALILIEKISAMTIVSVGGVPDG
jgi:hypothetical protein